MDRITERTYHRIAVREELDICVETPQDYDNLQHILSVLAAYEDAEQQGLLITLPCMIGDTVYVIAECEMVVSVLDGTYETATGYYCPYELDNKCPHDTDNCEECHEKTAVFEDTVLTFSYDGDELMIMTERVNAFGPIGRYIFLTREEAEIKLKEMEKPTNG